MRRRLIRIVGYAALAVLACAAIVAWLALASLPKVDGEIRLAGLQGPVQVVRDRYAVPHIRAGSAHDAWFALGFVHAQDRLWQMEFARRAGQGRLAEVLGASGLQIDRFMRTLGLAKRAAEDVRVLAPETIAVLDAYAAGFNAFLAKNRAPLPPEFLILRHRPEPWRPEDSVLFLKLLGMDLARNWREEILRARLLKELGPERTDDLWPPTSPDTPTTLAARGLDGPFLDQLGDLFPAEERGQAGSNGWVVDGRHSGTGKPLLANDPHLALTTPGPWYLAALEAPGLAVVGATTPGAPFVILGHNRDIAWGFTNTGADTQDLFVEQIDPADPAKYLTPEGSEPFAARQEVIRVRDAPDETITVRETRHGPVLSDIVQTSDIAGDGTVLALAWTQLAPGDRTADVGPRLARADSFEAMRAAFEPFAVSEQNVFYADREGRIGLFSPGRVPVRKRGDGTLPVPGWTGDYDWTGVIPYAELPVTTDPTDGVLFNANNRLVGPDYPYLITADWDPDLRARRLRDVLGRDGPFSLDDFQALQLDHHSTLADDFLPYLLRVAPSGTRQADALAALTRWDRVMDPARPEPLIFTAWYAALGRAIYADELGPLYTAYRGTRAAFLRRVLTLAPQWCDDVGTAAVESCDDRIASAFATAWKELEIQQGPNWRRWRLDGAQRALLEHRPFGHVPWLAWLFDRTFPIGGDSSTLNVAAGSVSNGVSRFQITHGPSYRALFDLADLDNSRFVTLTGQVGHPLSPHNGDATGMWRQGSYMALSQHIPEYPSGGVDVLRLVPAGPPNPEL